MCSLFNVSHWMCVVQKGKKLFPSVRSFNSHCDMCAVYASSCDTFSREKSNMSLVRSECRHLIPGFYFSAERISIGKGLQLFGEGNF